MDWFTVEEPATLLIFILIWIMLGANAAAAFIRVLPGRFNDTPMDVTSRKLVSISGILLGPATWAVFVLFYLMSFMPDTQDNYKQQQERMAQWKR